jgi:hypothetical protein
VNTSQTGLLSEILKGGKINKATLGYFRARLRNRIHQFIIREFMEKQHEGLTQADIARILDKRPEQIHRWLGQSSNLEIDTISDLILAISEAELNFSPLPLEGRPVRNFRGPDWLNRPKYIKSAAGPVLEPQIDRSPPPPTSSGPMGDKFIDEPSPPSSGPTGPFVAVPT